jgi:hypothetical protein
MELAGVDTDRFGAAVGTALLGLGVDRRLPAVVV